LEDREENVKRFDGSYWSSFWSCESDLNASVQGPVASSSSQQCSHTDLLTKGLNIIQLSWIKSSTRLRIKTSDRMNPFRHLVQLLGSVFGP